MGSLRKRFSTWALGGGDESPKRPVSMEVQRGSIDPGYHSILRKSRTEASSAPSDEHPFKSPPRPLHKALSTTFGYLADTVRQGAATFHKDSPEKDDPLSHRHEHENNVTPKKHNRRSSLFSSVRSRKSQFSPKTQETISSPVNPRKLSPTSFRVSDETAPSRDLDLPGSLLKSESPERKTGLQPASGARVLWPSPASVAVGLDEPGADRDDSSARVRSFVASTLTVSPSSKPSIPHPDDKGYVAEVESGAEQSEGEVFPSPSGDQVTSGLPGASSNQTNNNQQVKPQVRFDDGSGSPGRSYLQAQEPSSSDLKTAKRPQLTLRPIAAKQSEGRVPSELYEADVELSETSPEVTPSMGSRALWEQARADRDRRYFAAVGGIDRMNDNTPALTQLPESPTQSFANRQNEGSTSSEAIGETMIGPSYPMGALRYVVEASERQSGMDLVSDQDEGSPSPDAIGGTASAPPDPMETLRYAVEASDRRSGVDLADEEDILTRYLKARNPSPIPSMNLTIDEIMAFGNIGKDNQEVPSDTETDISGTSLSRQPALRQPDDAYEAGLRAAGLTARSYSRQSSVTILEDMEQTPPHPVPQAPQSTPVSHFRSVSNLSEVTNDSCAITTSSPSCDASPPFPALHVRSEPVRRISSALKYLDTIEKVDIPLTGPENSGFKPSSPNRNHGIETEPVPERSAISNNFEIDESSSRVTKDDTVFQEIKTPDSNRQKIFNAAKLPKFSTPSPLESSPKGRDSLQRAKRARGRVPFTATTGNAFKTVKSPGKSDAHQFSVRHFKSASREASPYTGYELDPVPFGLHFSQEDPGSSPSANDKKAVCFAEDIEIIGHNGGIRPDSPTLADEVPGAVDRKQVEKELEEKQDLALGRLMKKLDVVEQVVQGQEGDDKENVSVEEAARTETEKPRWRVPSKVTGS